MLKKLKVNLILCLAVTCVLLCGEPEKGDSARASEASAAKVLDITKVEENLHQLKKKLDVLPAAEIRRNAGPKKDPFVSLIPPPSTVQETEGEPAHEEKTPELIVSGIIFDGKSPVAIIGDEVKGEGELVGEYEVYKVMEDKVIIKRGDTMLPLEIKK
ncbi:MAG: hypothetical protein JW957_04320 [Candidatus Omnitrophica bacterium]|nr:hypothetical protein [Candidatus Omnitrophota bacterium]